MIPKLSKPNNAELAWIAQNLAVTREMIAEFNGGVAEIEPSLLDSAFAAWLSRHEPDTEDPNPVINALASLSGSISSNNCN